jgi:hypothetical protein
VPISNTREELIPKEISSEIIVIHYTQDEIDSDIESDGVRKVKDNSKPNIVLINSEKDQKNVPANAKDKFASAIMKGIELSTRK